MCYPFSWWHFSKSFGISERGIFSLSHDAISPAIRIYREIIIPCVIKNIHFLQRMCLFISLHTLCSLSTGWCLMLFIEFLIFTLRYSAEISFLARVKKAATWHLLCPSTRPPQGHSVHTTLKEILPLYISW
jgi:hypothetical protein